MTTGSTLQVCTPHGGYLPEGGDGVNVTAADPGNPSGHEIPDSNPTIVAAHSQLCSSSVEGTGEGFTARVKDPFIVLERWLALEDVKYSN